MSAPIDVFFSYSPADELSRQELEKHLAMLQRSSVIRGWSSRQIGAGEDWRCAIDAKLETARVILLLISSDFLASDYCFDVEITRALARAEAGEALVLAVLVRAYDWGAVPFGLLPVLPTDARPVESWSNQDEAWADVARGIRKAVEQLAGDARSAPARAGRTPRYSDARSRHLREQIDDAKQRAEHTRLLGRSTGAIDEEIRGLRNQFRIGGWLRAGDSLGDGRYLLIEPLGRGGFASVWLAETVADHQLVAIKVLHATHANDASRRARFFNGAHQMLRLDQAAVVRVIEEKAEDGGFFYFVMEYVAGEDLHRAVLGKRLPGEEVLPLILRIAEALAEAHAKGIVHRDVKPANILLDATRTPRLTDFDLVAVEGTTRLTEDGAMGTLVYSAPEMMTRPRDADARADVYGLAMTMMFCLTGAEPDPKVLLRDMARYIAALTCGDAMKEVLGRAVEWEMDERYANARALGDALREAERADSAAVSAAVSLAVTLQPAAALFRAPPLTADRDERAVVSLDGEESHVTPPLPSSIGLSQARRAQEDDLLDEPAGRPSARHSNLISLVVVLTLAVGTSGVTVGVVYIVDRWQRPRPRAAPSAAPTGFLAPFSFPMPTLAPYPPAAPSPCPDGMLLVPAATFWMGSPAALGEANEHPRHAVTLNAYCMDRTEVTVAQYQRCVTEPHNGLHCVPAPVTVQSKLYSVNAAARSAERCNGERTDQRVNHPINCVNWSHADTYCRWAESRLPTEAEWEYGAGGGERVYPWVGDEQPGPALVNACGDDCVLANSGVEPMYEGNDGWASTAPVGSYPAGASPFGLLDMAGNVWEWTSDWYGPYPSTSPPSSPLLDPQGPNVPSEKDRHVLRGGGWGDSKASAMRVTYRYRAVVSDRFDSVGFRCARGPRH